MLIIPTRQLPNDIVTVLVNGLVVKLNTMWNSREQAWYVSIYDSGENPLVLGQKLIQSQNLTARHGLVEFIDGDIYCFNTSTKQARPTFESLGDTLLLAYVTKEETIEIADNFSNLVIHN